MQKTNHKRNSGKGLIIGGLILLAISAGLVFYNYQESKEAADASSQVLEELLGKMKKGSEEDDPGDKSGGVWKLGEDYMPYIEIDGIKYLGVLSVPDLGLDLPVIADFQMGLLRTAPCRYAGTTIEDNLVIAGHNYASHFSPIRSIGLNTDVYFISVDNSMIHYRVDNVETLKPTQVKDMLTGEWDMTLFTCTIGGQSRHTVRCTRVEERREYNENGNK